MLVALVVEPFSGLECLRAADWVCVTAPVVESMVMVKTLLPAPLVALVVPVRVSPLAER